jgi:hypothetical protein
MMRSRAKAVGLGLALVAGHLRGAEPDGPWTAPAKTAAPTDPVWVSPRSAAAVPTTAPAVPLPIPTATPAAAVSAQPDMRPSSLPPLPAIPSVPVADAGTWQAPRPEPVGTEAQPESPPPRKLDPPQRVPQPLDKPRTFDVPRLPDAAPSPPAVSAAACELPPAPPELMVPHGYTAPGHWGAFGSPPISLGRDYPACRDVLDNCGLGGHRLFAPPTGGPAADRVFASAEYLLWWVNNQRIPALATTTTNGTTIGRFGFLNQPGTQALLGPGDFGDTLRSGFRVRAGAWLNECGTWGVDGGYFFTGRQSDRAVFDSGTVPSITRPIFAPNLGAEFGEVVARPGFSRGVLTVEADSALWGADANVRHAICRRCDFRLECFAGYRFLSLKESLVVTERITALENAPDPPGTQVLVQDSFRTKNRFHGGQIGGVVERKWGRTSLELRGSVALGVTNQEVRIDGFQQRTRPGQAREDFVGGLLAAGPNLGTFTRDKFSVVPELTVNLGYWVTPTVRTFVGYNVLYWSNVVRPGDQIDRVVDLTFVPNAPPGVVFSQNRPLPTFRQADLWANGVQFGVEMRW